MTSLELRMEPADYSRYIFRCAKNREEIIQSRLVCIFYIKLLIRLGRDCNKFTRICKVVQKCITLLEAPQSVKGWDSQLGKPQSLDWKSFVWSSSFSLLNKSFQQQESKFCLFYILHTTFYEH